MPKSKERAKRSEIDYNYFLCWQWIIHLDIDINDLYKTYLFFKKRYLPQESPKKYDCGQSRAKIPVHRPIEDTDLLRSRWNIDTSIDH